MLGFSEYSLLDSAGNTQFLSIELTTIESLGITKEIVTCYNDLDLNKIGFDIQTLSTGEPISLAGKYQKIPLAENQITWALKINGSTVFLDSNYNNIANIYVKIKEDIQVNIELNNSQLNLDLAVEIQ